MPGSALIRFYLLPWEGREEPFLLFVGKFCGKSF